MGDIQGQLGQGGPVAIRLLRLCERQVRLTQGFWPEGGVTIGALVRVCVLKCPLDHEKRLVWALGRRFSR